MKRFCSFLREHATNLINFDKKKRLPLTKRELKLQQNATAFYISEKNSEKFLQKIKNDRKVRDHYST